MKGLLIKDIKLMKNMIKMIGTIIMFSVVFSTWGENLFFSMGYISTFVAIMAISTINYDEFDNGFSYLFSLPFERKQYVQEKYLFSVGLILTGICISGIISLIVTMFTDTSVTAQEWGAVLIASVSVAVFMIALILPTQIKFGNEKGRMAIVIIAIVITMTIFGLAKLLEASGEDVESKLDMLFSSPAKMVVMAGIVVIIVLGVSYLISLKIIERKEF